MYGIILRISPLTEQNFFVWNLFQKCLNAVLKLENSENPADPKLQHTKFCFNRVS